MIGTNLFSSVTLAAVSFALSFPGALTETEI